MSTVAPLLTYYPVQDLDKYWESLILNWEFPVPAINNPRHVTAEHAGWINEENGKWLVVRSMLSCAAV